MLRNKDKRKGNFICNNRSSYVDSMTLTLPKATHSGGEHCSFRPRKELLIISWETWSLQLNWARFESQLCVYLDNFLDP